MSQFQVKTIITSVTYWCFAIFLKDNDDTFHFDAILESSIPELK